MLNRDDVVDHKVSLVLKLVNESLVLSNIALALEAKLGDVLDADLVHGIELLLAQMKVHGAWSEGCMSDKGICLGDDGSSSYEGECCEFHLVSLEIMKKYVRRSMVLMIDGDELKR
jgi:hypothetical protein